MVITKADIQYMRENLRMNISPEKETEILQKLGTEPDDEHYYTEQDLHEQLRKILSK